MANVMPILIIHQDMNSGMTQYFDNAFVTEDVMLVSGVSYTALAAAYRVLHGSI